ncbi:Nucleic-acid-binding protein from transposon X-element [Eumeta japonica]|uniref:Nucleic-acid-binding protein from transposon X-element n=1 Tax=Eumeta variegata TaxID=151549 RepID=A0A4C1X9E5_EUMVA|nr:Nucleic-acid-binding protein from transposon X-element [Eumeta japonica]
MKTYKNKNKRQASSSSDEGATCSDSTVVGSDSKSENNNTSFTLVEGKNKRALRKALKKAKVAPDQQEMDIDPSSAPTSRANDAKPSPAAVQQTQTTSTAPVESTRNPVSASTQAVTAKSAPRTGAKPTAPPRPKLHPPIFLRKGANFLQISADCTRLQINYSKAVRTADDGIKIHCPDIETFRSLNKYLVDFKVQFHTYAPEQERKLKAVIRGIPTDFPVDEIQADLCGQGFPVHSVHRLCHRDELLTIMASSRQAPHKKGGPGQCHRCQLYGHAAANCHADPRCVKCLVPHWTRECPRTRKSGEKPSCVNCLQQHTANYRGCPKAPKFISHNRSNPNWLKSRPVAPPRDLNKQTPAAASHPASNPWGKPKPMLPPRAAPGPSGDTVRREPPVSPRFRDRGHLIVWRRHPNSDVHPCAAKSSEISEFTRDFSACSNVEEKLMVFVRLESI